MNMNKQPGAMLATEVSKVLPKKRPGQPSPGSETLYFRSMTPPADSPSDNNFDFTELSNIRIESTYSCASTSATSQKIPIEQNSSLTINKMNLSDVDVTSSTSLPVADHHGKTIINSTRESTMASRKRPLQSSELASCNVPHSNNYDDCAPKKPCGQWDRDNNLLSQSNVSSDSAVDVDVGLDNNTKMSNYETEWPLPSEFVVGEGDASSGSVEGPNILDNMKSWQDRCHGRDVFVRYFNIWESNKFSVYRDVKFEVGSGKVLIWAHKLLLSVFCENGNFKNLLNNNTLRCPPIPLPTLEPTAFWKMLQYLYAGILEFDDVLEALSSLLVAETLGLQDLRRECMTFLKANISVDNAVKMLYFALVSKNGHLKDIAAKFITRNVWDVFTSNGFLQLSNEELFRFIQNDDWFIADEFYVFKNVIRWAIHQLTTANQTMENKPSGSDLRKVIGKVLYEIRFTTLASGDIFVCKMGHPYRGLFTQEEYIGITTYLAAKNLPDENDDGDHFPIVAPKDFNLHPRVKKELVEYPTLTTENDTEVVAVRHGDQVILDGRTEEPSESTGRPLPAGLGMTNGDSIVHEVKDDENLSSPKTKNRRRNNSVETNYGGPSSPIVSPSSPSLQLATHDKKDVYLHEYIMSLSSSDNSVDIDHIEEEIQITATPHMRVYLPNLKEFNLTVIPKNRKIFQCGSYLKTFLKNKLLNLSEILFFDKKRSTVDSKSPVKENKKRILFELLNSKVNIKITCQNITVLKINHEEGVIMINLLKDAQEILNGARDFPLKILALSECELHSWEPIPKSSLEVVLLRRVKGVKNYKNLLLTCNNLKIFSCNDMGNEVLNLTENVNPYLERLALAKGKIRATGNSAEHQNYLQELYLDNCDVPQDVLTTLPKLLPFVKRVQIYGRKCDAFLLHNILQIESVQWIFVWEFNYCRMKAVKNKSVLTESSKKVQSFLASVFDVEFSKKEKVTFILEKKPECIVEAPGTSHALQNKTKDPFDASVWTGSKIGKEKFTVVTKLDYRQFCYDRFFENFESYSFYESTEADLKKKKRLLATTNNNKLDTTLAEVTEPTSISSVDDLEMDSSS